MRAIVTSKGSGVTKMYLYDISCTRVKSTDYIFCHESYSFRPCRDSWDSCKGASIETLGNYCI